MLRMLRSRLRRPLAVAIAAASFVAAPLPSSATTAACAWVTVSAPNPGSGDVTLWDVKAIAGNDIWAVGSKDTFGATLAEHWNGKNWSSVTTPNPSGETSAELLAVDASASGNVWAVGYAYRNGATRSLTEHYNGSSWKVVSSPSPLSTSVLTGVAVISRTNVWAVGTNNNFGAPGSKQIILHYNGTSWTSVAGPSISGGHYLNDVSAHGGSNIWAVGGGPTEGQPLLEHYNGSSWQVETVSDPSLNGKTLFGIDLAAGGAHFGAGDQSGTAVLQTYADDGSGTATAPVSTQNQGPNVNFLYDNSVIDTSSDPAAATGGFAVGYHEDNSGNFVKRTLTERWVGGAWQIVSSPNATAKPNLLNGVDALSTSNAWAVGYARGSINTKALVEHFHC
jgi:hypothetical protein